MVVAWNDERSALHFTQGTLCNRRLIVVVQVDRMIKTNSQRKTDKARLFDLSLSALGGGQGINSFS